ncbi:MAG: hypothetical protein HOC33_04490 [Alphaproteobacteria bacterium]|nr:hypothetical protein [Alphaproteobacteria bacterium]MBT4084253.1 hypothetical protein [Alphaproteobacteria bacterium]MBT4543087.1 hypothetical protein [Alphaproteobacteria bacterium]
MSQTSGRNRVVHHCTQRQTPNRPALNPDSDLLEAGGSLMPDFSALICKKRVAPGQLPIIIIALSG